MALRHVHHLLSPLRNWMDVRKKASPSVNVSSSYTFQIFFFFFGGVLLRAQAHRITNCSLHLTIFIVKVLIASRFLCHSPSVHMHFNHLGANIQK